MRATKIKMKSGCGKSDNLLEIDSVYVTECTNPGYYKKEVLHDHLKKNPGTIQVDIWPCCSCNECQQREVCEIFS